MSRDLASPAQAALALAGALGVAGGLAACARPPLVLPAGPGMPFPEFRAAVEAGRAPCRGVRTWTAEVAVAGHAGATRLRGRVLVGLARPARLRLEGLAPFGQPLFILVADAHEATLWMPRDRRVLRHPSAGAVVAALAGVALEPDALLDLVTGCVSGAAPTGGRAYPGGWYAVDFDTQATAWLQRAGSRWRIVAGARGSLTVEYGEHDGGQPRRVRLRAAGDATGGSAAPGTDLTLRLAQIEVDAALAPQAFTVDVPAGAEPITLDELREQGPLGVRRPARP